MAALLRRDLSADRVAIDPSSLTRWRKRIAEEGVETLLSASINAARRSGVNPEVQRAAGDRGHHRHIKAAAHPIDSRIVQGGPLKLTRNCCSLRPAY